MFTLTHCLSLTTKAHETHFKLLSCWYWCPTLLQVSDLYWCCHSDRGSLAYLVGVSHYSGFLEFDPASHRPQSTLLSIIPGSIKCIKKGLLRNRLTAARSVILRHLRTAHVPPLTEWITEMDYIVGVPFGKRVGYRRIMP